MADQPDPGDTPPPRPRPKSGRKQPGGTPSPHDAVFRRIFGVPANAASQLRAVLPEDLAARLDLGRLAPVPGTFVDDDLRWRHSDVLFTAPLDGRDAFVYVLVEHQSSNDPLMAFRVLRYITRIWDQYERERPKTRRLPAVIPLVVYQGPGRWASPVRLLDLIDLAPADRQAVQAWLPRFEFLLDDLSRVSEDQLFGRKLTPSATATLLLLKNARGNPQITALLRRWEDLLRAVLGQPGGGEEFTAMLAYIVLVSETPAEELRDLAASLGPDAEEAYMTTADMLEARGEARGRARGEARGRAEDILVVIGQRGIGIDDKSRELIESCTDLDTLNSWFRRSLKVDKASDLFEE
jgi:predicted transposase/invertase (TIGR01784 family)